MAFSQDVPPHPVRSEPLSDGKPIARAPRSAGIRMGGAVLIVVGALLWLAGCRYTLMGWHTGVNWFLAWMGLSEQLPPIIGRGVFLALPIGLMYSLVELRRPWTYRAKERDAVALYWIVWGLIVVSDVGSTFLGVRTPGADASMLALQVAASAPVASAWALILTFTPEWFIVGGTKLLWR